MDARKRNPINIREFMEENKKGHSKVKDITKGIYQMEKEVEWRVWSKMPWDSEAKHFGKDRLPIETILRP